ncbi:MAG: hypothetical protein IJ468_06615 [Lachnospiraceae bacterium]|nr:hypothetical protein [Lachnospiraceae bacterium]
MKKRIAAVLVMCLFVCGLCSCSLMTKTYNFTAQENSIYVHEDGQITAAIIEDFEKDYYDVSELLGLAQNLVQEYNETYYGLPYYTYSQLTKEQKKQMLLPISLESVDSSNGKVTLVLKYANGSAFADFNGIDIKAAGGTTAYTSQLGSSKMALQGSFVSAKDGSALMVEELQKKTDYYLLYLDFATTVYFEHEVQAVSNNVTVVANNAVQTAAGQGNYILFK